ncbi:MAG: B12-binding domain-containing radical SAM protein [Planctomycetota bacterium]|nr:MAG: B12-binding domain-containing radical SAM protein [Planctomycetota bacterium]
MMKYCHVLCLYPYPSDPVGISIFPPTGLEYVATALKGHVNRVSLIDLRHERRLQSPARMAEFIRRGVDLICVSLNWKAQYRRACDYISQLPSNHTIIVGGREATEHVEDVLERCPNVDAVVRGEGEQTIQELADGRSWDQIQGLSYRQNGRIQHNRNRPLQPIEDILPPDRSLRRNRYVPVYKGIPLWPAEYDMILGSRGCPYRCKFCTFSLNPLGQKRDWVARSPESVVDEIEASKGNMIMFADDNFFLKPAWVERICDLLIERRIDKRYYANARLEVARYPHVLEKAYRAGFRMLLLGIESATDRILEQLGKGFNTRQVRDAFTVLRRFPFYYHAYFIFGNVGEAKQEMMAIADFANELGVHGITLCKLRVDEFTPLRKLVESTPGYWISPQGNVYSKKFDKKRLRRMRMLIRNRFLCRPGQLARSLSALDRCEILTYRQIMRIGFMTPLFLVNYLSHLSRKSVHRLRRRFASQDG